jgi:hypothetical protein
MKFDDINDRRNGLLLFKPVEAAFDHLQLCFLPRMSQTAQGEPYKQYVAYILDPSLSSKSVAAELPTSMILVSLLLIESIIMMLMLIVCVRDGTVSIVTTCVRDDMMLML